jgi:hypothetical protein
MRDAPGVQQFKLARRPVKHLTIQRLRNSSARSSHDMPFLYSFELSRILLIFTTINRTKYHYVMRVLILHSPGPKHRRARVIISYGWPLAETLIYHMDRRIGSNCRVEVLDCERHFSELVARPAINNLYSFSTAIMMLNRECLALQYPGFPSQCSSSWFPVNASLRISQDR